MSEIDMKAFRDAMAQHNIDERKGTSVNMNRNDVRAILSLHYTHMTSVSLLCAAFGLSPFSMGRILRGRTYNTIHEEFQTADKAQWDATYLRPDHVQRVMDARNGKPAPKKPQPPAISAERRAGHAGPWEAYRTDFDVRCINSQWVIRSPNFDDDREFASSKEAWEHGLARCRQFRVDFCQGDNDQFYGYFKEDIEWSREEWRFENWRRVSK